MGDTLPTLSIIGGTGALGGGLAARWAGAGYAVVPGSRSSEKAVLAAREIDTGAKAPPVHGTDNRSAADHRNTVIEVEFVDPEQKLIDSKHGCRRLFELPNTIRYLSLSRVIDSLSKHPIVRMLYSFKCACKISNNGWLWGAKCHTE